jgi:hypothetical protein
MMKTNLLAETFCLFRVTDGGQSLEVYYFRGWIKGVCEKKCFIRILGKREKNSRLEKCVYSYYKLLY